MRQILYIAILLLGLNTQAITQCMQAPKMNFSGTKIAWSYQVEDRTIHPGLCAGISYYYQKSNLWVKPIEYDDKFITIFGNGVSGTIINAMDKNTGAILWQKIYNHTNTEDTRGFVCGWVKNLGGDSLELLGTRAIFPYNTHGFSYHNRGSGYPTRIIISHDTGDQLDYQAIPGDNLLKTVGRFDWNDYPTQTPDGKLFHALSLELLLPKYQDTTFQGRQHYIDSKTLKNYLNFPPHNELPDNGAAFISFNYRGPNDERPDQVYHYPKLLQIESNVRALFYSYHIREGNIYYYHLLKIDNWGNFISDTDITDQIVKTHEIYPSNIEPEIINGDKIILQSYLSNGVGYVEIDFDGRLLKDRTGLVFDGLRPLYLKTIDLQDSDDLLHIFRQVDNNNIYFYREKPDGTYTKAGELINNNRPIYAFRPVIAKQARDGDLLVAFDILLDSITAGSVTLNTLEAWGYLIKIEAEELGIATRTQDQVIRERFSLFPNPTSSTLQIVTDAEYDHVLIQSTDGRIIKRMTVSDGAVNVSSLPNGTYICTLIKGSRTISSGVKFVKMGK